jgi:putative membrane protein
MFLFSGFAFIVGLVFVLLAAVMHVVIFYFESIAWAQPKIWKRFGIRSQEEADIVKPMAFNQGFYNLFLAIGIVIGAIIAFAGAPEVGRAVVLFGSLSMVAAATVLITSNPKLARAAVTQGALPLVGSILLLVSFA